MGLYRFKDVTHALSRFHIEECCDSPKIKIMNRGGDYESVIFCENCSNRLNGKFLDTAEELIAEWNDMIIERDRNKRDIVSVDVNLYPYPFAMV